MNKKSIPKHVHRGLRFGALALTLLVVGAGTTVLAQNRLPGRKHFSQMSVKEIEQALEQLKERSRERAQRHKQTLQARESQQEGRSGKGLKTALGKKSAPKQKGREGREEDLSDESGEYLEAYLNDRQLHGGPSGNVDPTALDRALAHKALMKPYGSAGAGTGGATAPGTNTIMAAPGGPGGGGSRWEFTGPRNLQVPYTTYYGPQDSYINGRINNAAYDPIDPNTIYVAAAGGGLWRTTDAGQNWAPLSDFTAENFTGPGTRPFKSLQTSCVAVHPTNRDILFVGTGDFPTVPGGGFGGYGICKSSDRGATWKVVNLPLLDGAAISWISVDPENPGIVLASATGFITRDPQGNLIFHGGLYRSTDGGDTFVQVGGGGLLSGVTVSSLTVGARDTLTGNRAYYASVPYANSPTKVFRSIDRGATWVALPVPLRLDGPIIAGAGATEVAASKINPATVFVIEASADDVRVFRSDNFGSLNTWVDITEGFVDGSEIGQPGYNLSQSWYDSHITTSSAATPQGLIDQVYVGMVNVIASRGGAPNWNNIGFTYTGGARTHNDQHGAAVHPNNPNRLIITNDGGVYGVAYSTQTQQWSVDQNRLNATLGVTQFYAADWHPTDPSNMLGGTQDNASPESRGDLFNWDNVGGGDGFACAIMAGSPNIQFATSQFLGIYATKDNWATSDFISHPTFNLEPSRFQSVIACDQTNLGSGNGVLFAGTDHLWRWGLPDVANDTDPWTADLGNRAFAGRVTAIGVSPVDGNFTYVGTENGEVWVTFNAEAEDPANPGRFPANLVTFFELLPNPMRSVAQVTTISVNPNNPFDILVGFGGGGRDLPRIYRCFNTASFFPTLAPVAGIQGMVGALPDDDPVTAITRLPIDAANTYVVGTDTGAYVSQDGGSTWSDLGANRGLPPVPVRAAKAIASTNYLNIATFGRGMWRISMRTLGPADFTVSPGLFRSAPNEVTSKIRVCNIGGPAKNVTITRVTIKPLRGGAGINASVLPPAIGNMDSDAVVTVDAKFTPLTGAPAKGSSVVVETAIRADSGGRVRNYIKSFRTRMP